MVRSFCPELGFLASVFLAVNNCHSLEVNSKVKVKHLSVIKYKYSGQPALSWKASGSNVFLVLAWSCASTGCRAGQAYWSRTVLPGRLHGDVFWSWPGAMRVPAASRPLSPGKLQGDVFSSWPGAVQSGQPTHSWEASGRDIFWSWPDAVRAPAGCGAARTVLGGFRESHFLVLAWCCERAGCGRGVRDAVYRPRYIALLDILSTPRAARDAVYRPRYIAPLKYSSTPRPGDG